MKRPVYSVAAIVAVTLLMLIAFFKTQTLQKQPTVLYRELPRVMGTESSLAVTFPSRKNTKQAEAALARAEQALRKSEILMSAHIESSEIGRLNAAGAGRIEISDETMEVFRKAQKLYKNTQGAFDVTCRPLIQLWKKAGQENRVPKEEEKKAARAESQWTDIEIKKNGVRKKSNTTLIDLGGIAKGYGIDQAAEAMKTSGVSGGLVNVGGDIRCFGKPPEGNIWKIKVKDPFKKKNVFANLGIKTGAVCTSGNYFRFTNINGRRYSHIIDPRTGAPAEAAASVTVVAPTAMVADAWATALSVLGPEGLRILPKDENIEAMIVTGSPEKPEVYMTKGFKKFLLGDYGFSD